MNHATDHHNEAPDGQRSHGASDGPVATAFSDAVDPMVEASTGDL